MSDDHARDISLLRRASEMGNAFACSTFSGEVWSENKEEGFRLAQLAAVQHERDGFDWLSFFFHEGLGCERDLNSENGNLLIAAELELVRAADCYGRLVGEHDPDCWLW